MRFTELKKITRVEKLIEGIKYVQYHFSDKQNCSSWYLDLARNTVLAFRLDNKNGLAHRTSLVIANDRLGLNK